MSFEIHNTKEDPNTKEEHKTIVFYAVLTYKIGKDFVYKIQAKKIKDPK